MASESFRGTGWAHPVRVDENGRIGQADERDGIDRSIALILGTAKGERIMRPDFGSDLHDFSFKPLSPVNLQRMATAVKFALMTWEPRVRVRQVEARQSPQDYTTALISIDYEVRRSNTKRNLVFPFYTQGAIK